MKARKPHWAGSSAGDYIAEQMADPTFRIAFAKARTKRIKQALAQAIERSRKRMRLSQTALAKRVQTTQAVISRIENPGTSYLPSVEVLSRIAVALGANLEVSFVHPSKVAA